ncbi:FecR domain-containing protein [Chitinophaga sp.]|uniref:FecR domain-containing protein n=1 Tax=Chitinophaga sp. TaxID=1869181 RepID=UPI0026305154|nr:FecR domain-containing protein [uncultured Chitinophaga sp.]
MLDDQRDKVRLLLQRYYAGSIGENEAAELDLLLQDGRYDALMQEVLSELAGGVQPMDLAAEDMDRMVSRIHELKAPAKVRSLPWRRIAAAAVFVLAIGAAGYWAVTSRGTAGQEVRNFGGDALPGSDKAILTLGDGSRINLNDAANGALASQGGGNAVKTGQGVLAYNASGDPVEFHTLATPRGGQYRLTLPDGSTAWLNAGSALRYPTAFIGKERKVELTGEAFFDIKPNTEMPFIVQIRNGGEVVVLGTAFNIQAYADDPGSRTTLVQGSVMMRNGREQHLLRPGQAMRLEGTDMILNDQADIEAATAWKNGLFLFRDAPVETVMKQLARWYDVEVVYEKGIVKEYFNGTIPRNVPLSKVLELLELTGLVHFTINGNKVTVSP